MKHFIPALLCSLFALGCFPAAAQQDSRATSTGTVTSKKQENTSSKNSAIAKVDFANFTFPEFRVGQAERSFTLKKGTSSEKEVFPKFTLRKTYYFDLTGDELDEAVSHVIAEGCQLGCEKSNLFYIYTGDNKQPKLLWKIATGGNVLGGLKWANFAIDEITMEVFGDCQVENQVIKPEVDIKKNANLKTTNYTRLVFTKKGDEFIQTSRTVLPLTANIDFTEFRPQISFGEPE